jgi:hypothetical protein
MAFPNFNNMSVWQQVGALVVTGAAIWGFIPDDIKLMTRGAHESDTQYTEESNATKGIHYYEWKLCNRETGQRNGRVLSPFKQSKLNGAYAAYLGATSLEYPLRELSPEDKCQVLKEDDL